MTLGERLRYARTRADLTQIEVQKRTHINSKTLSNWENGVSRPSADDLVVLANLYNVSTDHILGRKASEPSHYYHSPEVAEIADRLKNQPGMHMLFDASRNMTKQDIEAVVGLIRQFKGGD